MVKRLPRIRLLVGTLAALFACDRQRPQQGGNTLTSLATETRPPSEAKSTPDGAPASAPDDEVVRPRHARCLGRQAPDLAVKPPIDLPTDMRDGSCLVNASAGSDAGAPQRCAEVLNAWYAERPAFRCCAEGDPNASEPRHFVLRLTLSAAGVVETSTLERSRSAPASAELAECLCDVAREVRFPGSPRGRTMRLDLPIDLP